MKEYSGVGDIKEPLKNTVVTIGNFDGLHRGHQELFRLIKKKAADLNAATMAITFNPHPLKCIDPENHPPIITLHEQKKELIEKKGIDYLLTIPFSKEFANLTAIEFIEDILIKKLDVKAVAVGKDYMFGKKRQGNVALLKKYGEKFGFEVILPDWIKIEKERISSTLIRKAVQNGEMGKARSMLGRFYQIKGTIVHGRHRGNKIGFPTANLQLIDELCPKMGVYAVTAELDSKFFQGVANIGYSPTFEDHLFTIEVHLLGFEGDIYGETLKVNFIKRLRGEKKFNNIDELSSQIAMDVDYAKAIIEKL